MVLVISCLSVKKGFPSLGVIWSGSVPDVNEGLFLLHVSCDGLAVRGCVVRHNKWDHHSQTEVCLKKKIIQLPVENFGDKRLIFVVLNRPQFIFWYCIVGVPILGVKVLLNLQSFIFGSKNDLLLVQKSYCSVLCTVISQGYNKNAKIKINFLLFWLLVIINPGNVCLWWCVLIIKESFRPGVKRTQWWACIPYDHWMLWMFEVIGSEHFPVDVPRAAKAPAMGLCFFSSSHQMCPLVIKLTYNEAICRSCSKCRGCCISQWVHASFLETVKGCLHSVLEIHDNWGLNFLWNNFSHPSGCYRLRAQAVSSFSDSWAT